MNPYEVLGVCRDASTDDIRKAYRRLAKTAHPDVGGRAQTWEKLQLAHAVLSDADARAKYDATGDVSLGSPDNSLAEVLGILTVALEHLMDRAAAQRTPLGRINLLAAIRQQLQHDRQERHKQVGFMKQRVADLRSRVVRKQGDEGVDLFALMVSHYEKLADNMVQRCEQLDASAERVLAELEHYVDMLAMRLEDHRPKPSLIRQRPWNHTLGSIFDQ